MRIEFSIAEPAKRRRIENTERELIKRDSTCSYSSSNSSDGISNYESCDEGEQSDTLETSPSENYTLEQCK